ncbi:MAG: thiamine pyrophosphate-binding protein [Bradyrhizobium sp.]
MTSLSTPNTIGGRNAFIELLQSEGVTHLFGNPATTELPLMHALADYPDMRYVLGLQEAIVVAMADGYARASGELVACNVHVAPGLGNAMGSLFTAFNSGTPLLITAGQQEQGHGLTESLLYAPLVPIATPIVKWATEVTRLEDLPRIVHRAAKIATTPPTGPVFISLPGDILNAFGVIDLGQATRVGTRVRPSEDGLRGLAERLLRAQRPIDPEWLMLTIIDQLPQDAIIVDDALTTGASLPAFMHLRDRYAYFGNVSGGIGWAIAAAVGIQLAQPERKIVALLGDGSAMYSIQALWTAAHQKLPVVFVVFNNGGYRIIKQRLKLSTAPSALSGWIS